MSDKILKLSQAQTLYSDLRERIDALPTSEDIPDVPVQDVQVNGTSVLKNGIANVPLANFNTYGVSKMATNAVVKAGTDYTSFLTPMRTDLTVFYGLSKVAGVDLANETVTVGTYPETSKTAIRSMLGAGKVDDVQVNGTSILNNGVANIPIMTTTVPGVAIVGNGLYQANNKICANFGNAEHAKQGTLTSAMLPISQNHAAAFYGLAKAAGADEKNSTLPLGTYTETAKIAIRAMIGATSSNVIAVQDTQPTDTDTKIWLPETAETPVQIPTMEDLGDYVQKTDYATDTTVGVIKAGPSMRIYSSGTIDFRAVGASEVKAGTTYLRALTPERQHASVFYGLAKAAGADMASSDNAIGTYTDEAKTAIRNMIGAIGTTDYASSSNAGVIKIGTRLSIDSSGKVSVPSASSNVIKTGTTASYVLTPDWTHGIAFYGLAKAAGDATQATSDNAIGTYTDEAKSAIQQMLGIDLQSIASEVEIPLVETVSGASVTISGQPNTRYMCGEVTSISITPPASGTIDVVFTSGSTVAILTLPSTVKMPEWFDATTLDTNTIYEILITDGIYGSVMTWAA